MRPAEWTARMRIPFASIGWTAAAKAGDSVGFNVGRYRMKARQYVTWSPLKQGFNDTAHYGELVLGDYAAALKAAYLAACNSEELCEVVLLQDATYFMTSGGYNGAINPDYYTAPAKYKTYQTQGNTVHLLFHQTLHRVLDDVVVDIIHYAGGDFQQ